MPALGLSQATVSHHLKKLTDAGLLEREQRGKWAYFSLNPEAVGASRRPRRFPGGRSMSTDTPSELREQVRAALRGGRPRGHGGLGRELRRRLLLRRRPARRLRRGALLRRASAASCPDAAALASLGCGNPTAVAELHEGETVLDLGSGGGIDVILSAKRVGPTGTAYGLDMTDEMLALAQQNAREAGVANVHFLKGVIEAIPLPADSVDVVISNCVINLSADKPAVLDRDGARAQAGRPDRDHATSSPRIGSARASGPSAATTSAASPARSRIGEYEAGLEAAGFEEVERRASRTRSPTACTARSSRRARRAIPAARACRSSSRRRAPAAAELEGR